MDWLTKIHKGSSNKGHHHGKYGENRYWEDRRRSVDSSSDFDQEDLAFAIAISLSKEDQKGKKVTEEDNESLHSEESEKCKYLEDIEPSYHSEEDEKPHHSEDNEKSHHSEENDKLISSAQLEEDEVLARAIQASLNMEPPSQYYGGSAFPPYSFMFPSGYRICTGCNADINYGRYLSLMGGFWHPECFRCHACNQPITDYEFSVSDNRPYHKSCYKEQHHPRCYVCKNFLPTNSSGRIEYRAHPFWEQLYCPSHERDGTPQCCSCERMEPRETKYLSLDDGRKLCLECLDSAIVDTHECQPLYFEIREFYKGLNMKVKQEIPLFLVERQALNEAMEGEKNGHQHLPETRGLCLSEEQTVPTVLRRPRNGAGYPFIDIVTESYRLSRRCEVTAILILYGLPRLLTGSILVHEMMHAWLRLKGYPNLKPEVEEGICQVLAHMWLDSEIPSSSSSTSTKKGKRSNFEKKLGELFKHLIETDTSSAYGDGFRTGNQAVLKYGLRRTLDHIEMTGNFPV